MASPRRSSATEASLLSIDGHTTYVEKKQPDYKSQHSSSCDHFTEIKDEAGDDTGNGNIQESLGNIYRGEEVRGSLGNPFWNWQKMMEEMRGTEVWQKIMEGSGGTKVYDIRNWQKIMDQVDTQVYNCEKSQKQVEGKMNFQEEQGQQHNQNRYRSEELRGTEGVGLEEENQKWESLGEEQRKIQEEEGRQYNQNRYRTDQMKETGVSWSNSG